MQDEIQKPNPLPLPRGESTYALAKRAEYKEKDLIKAESLYKQAIFEKDRIESAIKDLASILNQQNRIDEAINLLQSHKEIFKSNMESYKNLLTTLEKHLSTSEKNPKKNLKISGLAQNSTEHQVKSFFKTPSRIKKISFFTEIIDGSYNYYAIVVFSSPSSARKTLGEFTEWDKYTVEWISESGVVLCNAHYAKQKIEIHRKKDPTFEYKIFEQDPRGYIYSLALDQSYICEEPVCKILDIESLIGSRLYTEIFVAS